MFRRLRGFLNLLAGIGERAELDAANGVLKSRLEFAERDRDQWKQECKSAEQLVKIGEEKLAVQAVSIDGLTAIVEQYRQEQLAQARTYAMKAQPPSYDDRPE